MQSHAKDSLFSRKRTLNCKGKIVDLTEPKLMGILNVTPDSFFDGGRYNNEKNVLERVEQMLLEGADFVDVGGMSTRPGAKSVGEAEELKRVVPVIELLTKKFAGIMISVDTYRAKVAREAIQAGAVMINDVSGGNLDENIFQVAGDAGVPYILMHMQGVPETMQEQPAYKDVVPEIVDYFLDKINKKLKEAGVKDIIIDPGFGFGKTLAHNYEILKNMDYFDVLELPRLIGVSRKSMICKALKVNPEGALNGTTVVHALALLKGVDILRVHDIKPAKEAIKILHYYTTV